MALFPASLIVRKRLRIAFILSGVVMTTAGAVGTRTYVAPAEARKSALDGEIAESTVTVEILRNATAQYYALGQQTALISALGINVKDAEARKLLETMRKSAFLEQAGPVRQIIGRLALAKRVRHYGEGDRPYAGLVAQCTKEFSQENQRAVSVAEKAIVGDALALSRDLVVKRLDLLQREIEAGAEIDRRKLTLLVLQSVGSALLVLAYLF